MFAPQAPAENSAAPVPGAAVPSAAGATTRGGLLTRAEPLVCRLLWVSPQAPAHRPSRRQDVATHRLFNVSIGLSALRCLLSYVLLPIVVPAVGGAARVPPVVGLPVGLLALVFDVVAVRRFWASRHPWRWPVTGIYLLVMALVLALLVGDVTSLAT